MIGDQLLLLLVSHLLQRVVLALEVSAETAERFLQNFLQLAALPAVAGRGQTVASDAPAGADSAAEDVVGVELSVSFDVSRIQVSRMFRVLSVSAVSRRDDRVEEGSEFLVGVLVSGDTAYRHDVGVSRVVHSGLDSFVYRETRVRLPSEQLTVDLVRHALGHPIVVFGQVWVVWVSSFRLCHLARF